MPNEKKHSTLANLKTLNTTKESIQTDSLKVINNHVSFNKVKEFKKRTTEQIMPTMTCHTELVEAFKTEAKAKHWKFTTLMNQILSDRYGIKIEE